MLLKNTAKKILWNLSPVSFSRTSHGFTNLYFIEMKSNNNPNWSTITRATKLGIWTINHISLSDERRVPYLLHRFPRSSSKLIKYESGKYSERSIRYFNLDVCLVVQIEYIFAGLSDIWKGNTGVIGNCLKYLLSFRRWKETYCNIVWIPFVSFGLALLVFNFVLCIRMFKSLPIKHSNKVELKNYF